MKKPKKTKAQLSAEQLISVIKWETGRIEKRGENDYAIVYDTYPCNLVCENPQKQGRLYFIPED